MLLIEGEKLTSKKINTKYDKAISSWVKKNSTILQEIWEKLQIGEKYEAVIEDNQKELNDFDL